MPTSVKNKTSNETNTQRIRKRKNTIETSIADTDHDDTDLLKLALMIGDVRLREESHGVAGDVYILDASVATPTHFAKFTPSLVKKFLVCVQEAYPVKLKEVHVVNISPIVDTIVSFAKPLLNEKIRNRIFLHSDLKTLYEYVPREMLPSEYGGDAGPTQAIWGTTVSVSGTLARTRARIDDVPYRIFV